MASFDLSPDLERMIASNGLPVEACVGLVAGAAVVVVVTTEDEEEVVVVVATVETGEMSLAAVAVEREVGANELMLAGATKPAKASNRTDEMRAMVMR
jgi:hypothetical protein